ncbi:hypothetical protein GCM10010178_40080 [Lentzea flava]|uniref:Uncharacterized protein n=1 Tax=Lentzea flava TaxID=103732 RepID=A0ABQ2ULG1_9PSEU|nr:hypothetical protein GCM10010178_40080 [Lentzea flava]
MRSRESTCLRRGDWRDGVGMSPFCHVWSNAPTEGSADIVDVVIAGAGPVDLFLAGELALADRSVL